MITRIHSLLIATAFAAVACVAAPTNAIAQQCPGTHYPCGSGSCCSK